MTTIDNITPEAKALGAFLSAMNESGLNGAAMRETMIGVLGSAALAQQAEQDEVGINGLTDAETRATMSVMGLSKPKKTYFLRAQML